MKLKGPYRLGGVLVALLAIALPDALDAQAADTLRRDLRLPLPSTYAVAARGDWVSPGIAIGVPTGFGADWGDAFAAVGLQSRTRYRDAVDGGVVFGFGLGDAQRALGLELAVSSFGTFRSCCRGGLSAKVHRVLPRNSSIAVGYENALTWGRMAGEEEATDAGRSLYLAGTSVFLLRPDPSSFLGTAAVTAGIGNGRFRRESDILNDRERVNPSFSAGVRVAEPASVVASWTGQDLVAGVSLVPFRRVPLFITPGVADLTTSPRFILGIGYGFDFSPLF
jgi:hypothetical protein